MRFYPLSLIIMVTMLCAVRLAQPVEPQAASDPFGALDAGLDEVDDDMEELKKLLESESGIKEPDQKTGPAQWKRKYYSHYVIYNSPDSGALPEYPHQRMGITMRDAYVPPVGQDERDIFWAMGLSYEFRGYSNGYVYESADLHRLRIKKDENPDEAIRKIMDRYRNDVGEQGKLRRAFIYDITEKHLRGEGGTDPLQKFTVEKLSGPFNSPDDACGAVAGFYSLKGDYQTANMYRNEGSDQVLRLIWDNPKFDKEVYHIFWQW